MAEAATEFEKIGKGAESLAHHAEITQHAMEHTSTSVGTIVNGLLLSQGATRVLNAVVAQSPLLSGFKTAFDSLHKTQGQIRSAQIEELDALMTKIQEGKITEAQANAQLDMLELRQPLLNAEYKLVGEMNRVGLIRLGLLGATVTALQRQVALQQDFNQEVIKSSADWSTRTRLFYDNLLVVRQTGMAFDSVADAQRELIQYGMQTRNNYASVLQTVVQLHEALGMSVHQAAELAVITERQTKTSFQETANVVAELTDNTSLAADEVGRMAANLGRAMAVIRPGGVQDFPQIVGLVGKYEDALKQFGGQVGQFEQLIGRMTRPEGLMQAGVLGISSPESLLKTAGVDKAIDKFYQYAVSQLAGARGFDRMFRLDMLAEQFGTTAEQINAMVQAVEAARASSGRTLTLQERFQKQMEMTGKGIMQAYNALVSLVQGGLYPVIAGVNVLTGLLATVVTTVLKYKPLAYAAMAIVDAAIVVLVIKLHGAARAFWEVVLAAQVAAVSLKRYAEQQALQSLQTGTKSLLKGGAVELEQGLLFNELGEANLRQGDLFGKTAVATLSKQAPRLSALYGQAIGDAVRAFKTSWNLPSGLSSLSTLGTQLTTAFKDLRAGSLSGVGAMLKSWVAPLSGIGTTIGRILLAPFTLLLRGITLLLSPLGIIAAGVAWLGYLAFRKHQVDEQSKRDQERDKLRIRQIGDEIVNRRERQIYLEARAGKFEDARAHYVKLMEAVRAQNKDKGPAVELAEQAKVSEQVDKFTELAGYTFTQFDKIKVTPQEQKIKLEQSTEFQEKIAMNTKLLNEAARRTATEESIRRQREAAEAELRSLRGPDFGRQPSLNPNPLLYMH